MKVKFKQVKPYCMSRNLIFTYNNDTNEGFIFGGFRVIGEFCLEVK